MALGADRRDVFALIMKQGALQTRVRARDWVPARARGLDVCSRKCSTRSARAIRSPWLEPAHAWRGRASRVLSAGASRHAREPDEGLAHRVVLECGISLVDRPLRRAIA